jgi:uncharacterized membrane protein YdfJ with MMPL/SSD domain
MALIDFIPILGDISAAIRKAVPDATERDRIAGELDKAQAGIQQAQAEITAADAASGDRFRAWWRPAVGWMCVFGLWLDFILFPLVSLTLQLAGKAPIMSPLDVASLMALLGALLGLGGLRTVERVQGKA